MVHLNLVYFWPTQSTNNLINAISTRSMQAVKLSSIKAIAINENSHEKRRLVQSLAPKWKAGKAPNIRFTCTTWTGSVHETACQIMYWDLMYLMPLWWPTTLAKRCRALSYTRRVWKHTDTQTDITAPSQQLEKLQRLRQNRWTLHKGLGNATKEEDKY